MKFQHDLKTIEYWKKLTYAQQMANVGAEVGRAINWKNKANQDYSRMAYERALELLMLTKMNQKSFPVLKETARVYESLVDFFQGDNVYGSSDELWNKYFNAFGVLASRERASNYSKNT